MNTVKLAKRTTPKLKPGQYLFQGQVRSRQLHPPSGDKVTRDSFAAECDATTIVDTYARTGILPANVNRGEPQYGETHDQSFFESACINAELASMEEEGRFESLSEAPEETNESESTQPQQVETNVDPAPSEDATASEDATEA